MLFQFQKLCPIFSVLTNFGIRLNFDYFLWSAHAPNAADIVVTNSISCTNKGQRYKSKLSHIDKHIGQLNGFLLSHRYLSGIRHTSIHIHAQSMAVIGISKIILSFWLLVV